MYADTDHIFFKASREKHVDVDVCILKKKNFSFSIANQSLTDLNFGFMKTVMLIV